VVNVNPLYTPRELEHQLKDSGSEAIVFLRELRPMAPAGDREDPREARGDRSARRPARAKGLIVNFILRRVKKMVPRWELPGAIRFNAMIREGAR